MDGREAGVEAGRIAWLEDPGREFPYWRGDPVALPAWGWFAVMAGVAAGFLAVALPISWPGGEAGALAPAVLLVAVPLGALALVAGGAWRVLFARVSWREIRLMAGFALLNLAVTMAVGVAVSRVVAVESNPAFASLAEMAWADRILFFLRVGVQLLGEEVVSILAFLALMALLAGRFGAGRRSALVGAWLLSALLFGLVHLPTYGWNVAQSVVIIGVARLVLTLPWIMTKNLWVSTGAHVLNDWALMAMVLLGGALSAGG